MTPTPIWSLMTPRHSFKQRFPGQCAGRLLGLLVIFAFGCGGNDPAGQPESASNDQVSLAAGESCNSDDECWDGLRCLRQNDMQFCVQTCREQTDCPSGICNITQGGNLGWCEPTVTDEGSNSSGDIDAGQSQPDSGEETLDAQPARPTNDSEPMASDGGEPQPDEGVDLVPENNRFPPVESYSAAGPFEVERWIGGPGNLFVFLHPAVLGQDGLQHPILTWGNGTGATPIMYDGLLRHFASHGFIVVAPVSPMTGTGIEMMLGVDWLIEENERAGSRFENRVATERIGALGHSQGGRGAIQAGRDSRVVCTAPIQPVPGDIQALQGPTFLIGGEFDTVISPTFAIRPRSFLPSPVPTIYGVRVGADHYAPLGAAEESMRRYITAWFRLHLMDEDNARPLFFGDNCGICEDRDWIVERRNL